MTLNLTIPTTMHTDFTPRITVVGVGGGGTNAVDNMIALNLRGVEFIVANTDAQQLAHSKADRRIQLGPHLTQGLGAGAKPEIGRAAAEEAADELVRHLDGVHMVFITAGMGGGTGTGAAPVIARMARERGILTVGVVTKPFTFEGVRRTRAAESGISELQQYVDTLIVIPNQNLFRIANEKTTFADAFKMADEVLHSGVRGVTDLMVMPGLINLDFADIRTVMSEMGKAMMGTGEAEGARRAIDAAEAAISNPLLDEVSLKGARAMLINITAGMDIALFEVDEAVNRVRAEVDPDANVIFGSTFDPTMEGRLRVSVVATGIDAQSMVQQPPVRQPTLDVIRGGADTSPIRKTAVGGFSAMAASPAWPAMSPGLSAQAVTMTATAEQLHPESFATPVAEPAAAETVAEAAQEAAPEASETAPAYETAAETSANFIPPRPMESFARPPAQPATTPEPAAQQPAPAMAAAERKRSFSLFERVTGAARRAETAANHTPSQPAPQGERAMPTFGARVAPRTPTPDTAMIPMGQPRLGIDAPAKTKASSPEDDLLEIPAFLRRQAN
jgi:cell division protein FtsZ